MIFVGKRLQDLREERHLTRIQLAEKTGIDRAVIFKYERYRNSNPTLRNIYKLCCGLNISIQEFFNYDFEVDNG